MLEEIGCSSLDMLVDNVVPDAIRSSSGLNIGPACNADGSGFAFTGTSHSSVLEQGECCDEQDAFKRLHKIGDKNEMFRSLIGMGYYSCITPPVILRHVLKNPGWYTAYTPYQAEIAQGRLEMLLAFQTMVGDLTGLPLANASLLDEATAAAEAMTMCLRIVRNERNTFFVSEDCHPQTIAVVKTRAESFGMRLVVGSLDKIDAISDILCGVLLQYPTTQGYVNDYEELVAHVHDKGALVVVATDLMALTLLRAPGEFGADIAIGTTQRFGMPLGFGGPHAAFISTRDIYQRQLPGRLVGVSHDASGDVAYRLTLQTREQHIRRDRATSNICTAQVLPAICATFYAVYHGAEGMRRIAKRIHAWTTVLARGLTEEGYSPRGCFVF